MLQLSPVFDKILQARKEGCFFIINRGGTSSTKTYSTLQYLIQLSKKNPKYRIDMVGLSAPHLKEGLLDDLASGGICDSFDFNFHKNFNENKGILKTGGGGELHFTSFDKPGKAHGGRRDILYLNECNHMKWEVVLQLIIRTRVAVFMDFNPSSEFWLTDPECFGAFLKEAMKEGSPIKLKEIRSTYLDNPFLSDVQKAVIEAKKGNNHYWQVYGLGEYGQAEGRIFTNVSDGEFDDSLPFGFALDPGGTDPNAFVKCALDHKQKKLYVEECFYETNLSTATVVDYVGGFCGSNDLIIVDLAGKALILDLQENYFNAIPCIKGPGSIIDGINLLLEYEIIICGHSPNLRKEVQNYVWSDKKANIPIDAWNHLIDAIRYYVYWLKFNTVNATVDFS